MLGCPTIDAAAEIQVQKEQKNILSSLFVIFEPTAALNLLEEPVSNVNLTKWKQGAAIYDQKSKNA